MRRNLQEIKKKTDFKLLIRANSTSEIFSKMQNISPASFEHAIKQKYFKAKYFAFRRNRAVCEGSGILTDCTTRKASLKTLHLPRKERPPRCRPITIDSITVHNYQSRGDNFRGYICVNGSFQ